MPKQHIEEYGWTAVPTDLSNLPSNASQTSPVPVPIDSIWPDTPLVQKAQEYIKSELPPETYNHSLRVYCFGYAILSLHSPEILSTPTTAHPFLETWALTCLFHDLATTPSHRANTHLSFEFQGGYLALQKLLSLGAPLAQAESVCEAVILHQSTLQTGMQSRMAQLCSVSTGIDVRGGGGHLVDRTTLDEAVEQFPRLGWSRCFAHTIRGEIAEKPWCHSTSLVGFAESIEGNELMGRYE